MNWENGRATLGPLEFLINGAELVVAINKTQAHIIRTCDPVRVAEKLVEEIVKAYLEQRLEAMGVDA